MRSRLLLVAGLTLLLAVPATAANNADAEQAPVTYYKDVLPLVQENCQTCHRENGANLGGMVAPMAFMTYAETRPWAKSIARKVEAREMPPWHASPDQAGVFENERTLTDAEITTFVRWAKTGAAAGDAADAPEAREFATSEGWLIGVPDLVVEMPEKYLVADDIEDHYIHFESLITEEMLPEPRWVQAVEFRPGSSAVHHIIAPPLGGIAPGNDPTIYREGYGTLLKPNTKVTWQMHYHKEPGEGTKVWDQSRAAIRFYPQGYEPTHVIQSAPMGNLWFEIPAGDPDYTSQVAYTFERDSKIVGLLPHAHLRGKSAKYVAYYPDGEQEVLLEVPSYDFNWQTTYRFREEKAIPAGTQVELTMSWDNSTGNPHNPDATKTVAFGQPTTDEMMFGFMAFTDAEEGYKPKTIGGFGSRREGGERPSPQEMMRTGLGIDLDSLSPEDKQRLMKSFANGGGFGRRREGADAGE